MHTASAGDQHCPHAAAPVSGGKQAWTPAPSLPGRAPL